MSQIHVRFIAPIGHATRKAMRRLIAAVPVAVRLAHGLEVLVVPAKTIRDYEGRFGFAAFFVPGDGPQILIAGVRPEPRVSDTEHARHLTENLAHELAHYEQWRDGRRLTERGVAVRSRAIVRGLRKAVPHAR